MWPSPHRLPAWVPGPAEDEDKEMSDAVTTERATPPTKRLKGFVAASQKTTAPLNKPVSLVPVDGRPGYFKLVDLPDLFPVLPASAATLLRDVTVEEAVSLFHKFVGKNLTEDLVVRILEAYVPMKIQIRQEEVWASQFQRNKACIGTQRMHRLDAGHSDYKFMCKACGTGWPEAANQCWSARARSPRIVPSTRLRSACARVPPGPAAPRLPPSRCWIQVGLPSTMSRLYVTSAS